MGKLGKSWENQEIYGKLFMPCCIAPCCSVTLIDSIDTHCDIVDQGHQELSIAFHTQHIPKSTPMAGQNIGNNNKTWRTHLGLSIVLGIPQKDGLWWFLSWKIPSINGPFGGTPIWDLLFWPGPPAPSQVAHWCARCGGTPEGSPHRSSSLTSWGEKVHRQWKQPFWAWWIPGWD